MYRLGKCFFGEDSRRPLFTRAPPPLFDIRIAAILGLTDLQRAIHYDEGLIRDERRWDCTDLKRKRDGEEEKKKKKEEKKIASVESYGGYPPLPLQEWERWWLVSAFLSLIHRMSGSTYLCTSGCPVPCFGAAPRPGETSLCHVGTAADVCVKTPC